MFSTYHPGSDNLTEVVNQTLEMYMFEVHYKCSSKEWLTLLPWAEYPYNKLSHFNQDALIGSCSWQTTFTSLIHSMFTTTDIIDQQLRHRDQLLEELKENLKEAQQRMKLNAGKHREEKVFNIDDSVYLRLHPYRQTSLALDRHTKLSSKFCGPYRIIGTVATVACKLELPTDAKVHNIFPISLLIKK